MGYGSTARRAGVTVAASVGLVVTSGCADEPIRPSIRTAIEEACEQVYLLQDQGTADPAKAVESVLWGQTQSAMASSVEERAEALARHLADMKRILVAADARSANPSPDLAAFGSANESAARECRELEDGF
jgi:hypothetical protein